MCGRCTLTTNLVKFNFVMRNKDKKLTSVKLDPKLYEEFKIECLKDNFSLQKLASNAIFLYLNDKDFRTKLKNKTTTQ